MKGILISFEGIDGSGKSTQSKKLYSWLKRRGYKTIHLEEPGGTKLGDKLREILLYAEEISEFSELFLFFACRAQLVKEIIRPSLREGKIVIIDRFFDSTLAYQGYGRGLNKHLITKLDKIVTGGIIPNLTLLLDKGPKFVLKKTGRRRDKFENESLSFH